MIYSVWDAGSRSYDYFQTAAATPTAPPEPTHLRSKALGLAPEDAAWPLPADAQWIGRGAQAKGKVASRRSGGALGDFASGNALPMVGLALAAYLLWRSQRRRR
jgi:hypothetical protein